MLENADYFVRVVNLPIGVGGIVTPNDDGTYSVYINARNTQKRQEQSLEHEVGHIERDDLYNNRKIEEVEGW